MAIRTPAKRKKSFYSKQGSRVTERTARKEHQCSQCYGDINPGDKYHEVVYEGDDWEHHTAKICKDCWGKQ